MSLIRFDRHGAEKYKKLSPWLSQIPKYTRDGLERPSKRSSMDDMT